MSPASLGMSPANEQGHSSAGAGALGHPQAFAMRLASIDGTARKALGARAPTKALGARAPTKALGARAPTKALGARAPARPQGAGGPARPRWRTWCAHSAGIWASRRRCPISWYVSCSSRAGLTDASAGGAAARTMAGTTEPIQGCLFFLYDVLRLVKHAPKWYAASEIERPGFLVNLIGLDIPSHTRCPAKVDVERAPREASTSPVGNFLVWLAASRRLTGVSQHARLDRQPRLPPDFIVAGRVSVLLSWTAATRRGPRSGRAARANDENQGAAKRKGAAKNAGAANNLNKAQARQQGEHPLRWHNRADKKAAVGDLRSSNKRPRSAMGGEGVIGATKGTGEAAAHSRNQRAKRTRASEKGADRNRRSEESAEHPRASEVAPEVKEEEVEVEEAEIVEEEPEGRKEEEVVEKEEEAKGEGEEVKVEAEEAKVEVEEVKVKDAEVKAEDTLEAPTNKDDQEMGDGVREMDVDDEELGDNDHIIGDDEREMGDDDQEMDYVEEMLAPGGDRVRETLERSLEIGEEEEWTYPTWTVYTEPSADEEDGEDDDEEANDSDDSSESDEDAEGQLAPMSSSPPPFEASRKRAMPGPARIPSPPWQMSGI
ncbi:hypothetical protein GGF50DRAFT_92369 [Schizophyllum commune]